MSLKLIGAGVGRTGTLSLRTALETLLGEPCYHMFEVRQHPEHIPLWHAAARGEAVDWRALLAPYGAAALRVRRARGLDQRLAPRIVTAQSIGQAFQFVATGNAEIGFVGRPRTAGARCARRLVCRSPTCPSRTSIPPRTFAPRACRSATERARPRGRGGLARAC